MFQRRTQPSVLAKIRNFLWPSIGWRRSCVYLGHRVGRLPGTPYSIAAGFACGAAIAMTPFVGIHIFIAMAVAWALRASPVAAALGGLLGNVWTWPIILPTSYYIGNLLLGYETAAGAPAELTWALLWQDPAHLLIPMMLGGAVMGIPLFILFYFPIHYAVISYRRRRLQRRQDKNAAYALSKSVY